MPTNPRVFSRRLHRMAHTLNQLPALAAKNPAARAAIEAALERVAAFARAHREHPEAVPSNLCPCADLLTDPVRWLTFMRETDRARLRAGLPARYAAEIREAEAILPVARAMPGEFPLLARKRHRRKNEPRYDVAAYSVRRAELAAELAELEKRPAAWQESDQGRAALDLIRLRIDLLRAARCDVEGKPWHPLFPYDGLRLDLSDWRERVRLVRGLGISKLGFYHRDFLLRECLDKVAGMSWRPDQLRGKDKDDPADWWKSGGGGRAA